jgi:hypothetical protein
MSFLGLSVGSNLVHYFAKHTLKLCFLDLLFFVLIFINFKEVPEDIMIYKDGSKGGRGWAYVHSQLLKILFTMVILLFFYFMIMPSLSHIMPLS